MKAICISNFTNDLTDPSLQEHQPLIGCEYEIDALTEDGWYFIQELQPPGQLIAFEPENFKLITEFN